MAFLGGSKNAILATGKSAVKAGDQADLPGGILGWHVTP